MSLLYYIPCHRVVATNGLGGYAFGVEAKKQLLRNEKMTELIILQYEL